ncbi:50S ribosomal protein L30e-like protein [Podospora appendiculata]|uniref:50S ribosomal protein L30e-like protein n=1 Tax=Podospora appendiculata TaxID=314037 RepID=A0AAE1C7E8_9PEZI|nr:50S ribosomal protein L30e-like protein [Podospora appendiculata]
MASGDKVNVVDDKKLKKEKKSKDKSEKKEKRSESSGVSKKKEDKKEKKSKSDKLARALESDKHVGTLDAQLQADVAASADLKEDKVEELIKPAEELVPFALPLADDKAHKKIFKLIKKGAKLRSIHRGVKECEKAIKKCPLKKGGAAEAPGLVIIAGDISPMDVIMHFPILCEEHGVPYLYIKSRAELGVAACTKRATSVVMLKPEGKKAGPGAKKTSEDADMEDGEKKVSAEEYLESWKDLVKVAQKQWHVQVEPWVKGVHALQVAANSKRSS